MNNYGEWRTSVEDILNFFEMQQQLVLYRTDGTTCSLSCLWRQLSLVATSFVETFFVETTSYVRSLECIHRFLKAKTGWQREWGLSQTVQQNIAWMSYWVSIAMPVGMTKVFIDLLGSLEGFFKLICSFKLLRA